MGGVLVVARCGWALDSSGCRQVRPRERERERESRGGEEQHE